MVELEELKNRPETMIFYEAPHRLKKTLKTMQEVFGKDRRVVLSRELTKRYEEFLRGTLADANEWAQTQEIRGEFVILVAGNDHPDQDDNQPTGSPIEQIDQEIENGLSTNAAIKLVAKRVGIKRQELYKEYHQF